MCSSAQTPSTHSRRIDRSSTDWTQIEKRISSSYCMVVSLHYRSLRERKNQGCYVIASTKEALVFFFWNLEWYFLFLKTFFAVKAAVEKRPESRLNTLPRFQKRYSTRLFSTKHVLKLLSVHKSDTCLLSSHNRPQWVRLDWSRACIQMCPRGRDGLWRRSWKLSIWGEDLKGK